AVELALADPSPPPLDGLVESLVEVVGRRRVGRGGVDVLGTGAADCEADSLAGADIERGVEVVIVQELELDVGGYDQGVVTADGAVDPVAVATDPCLDLAIVEARCELEIELHAATNAFDDAQQLPTRLLRATAPHCPAVVDHALPVVGPEGG